MEEKRYDLESFGGAGGFRGPCLRRVACGGVIDLACVQILA